MLPMEDRLHDLVNIIYIKCCTAFIWMICVLCVCTPLQCINLLSMSRWALTWQWSAWCPLDIHKSCSTLSTTPPSPPGWFTEPFLFEINLKTHLILEHQSTCLTLCSLRFCSLSLIFCPLFPPVSSQRSGVWHDVWQPAQSGHLWEHSGVCTRIQLLKRVRAFHCCKFNDSPSNRCWDLSLKTINAKLMIAETKSHRVVKVLGSRNVCLFTQLKVV